MNQPIAAAEAKVIRWTESVVQGETADETCEVGGREPGDGSPPGFVAAIARRRARRVAPHGTVECRRA